MTAASGNKRKRKSRTLPAAKVGLPPGTLVHVGEIKTEQPLISTLTFDEHGVEEQSFDSIDALNDYRPGHQRLWLNVHGLQDPAILAAIGQRYHLHPLVLEDILNTHQRPKIDNYGDYLFFVARIFEYDPDSRTLISDQVSIVLGKDFVLSFQERRSGIFEPIRERLRAEGAPLRRNGGDYLVHALLDAVVDRYFVVLDQLGNTAEDLEDAAIGSPTPDLLKTINLVKHDCQLIRRAIWPLRDVLNGLIRDDHTFFTADSKLYLRDIADHTIHVIETLDTVRDLLSDLMDIYLSAVSNRLNLQVRILTVLTTIFLPATLIAGIFGMNFEYMPIIGRSGGFYIALGLMAVIALGMAAIFWRRNWLKA